MKTPSTERDREMADLLDRLACGELEEAPRRELLAWLEEDPLRWRLCGLAFLEAQTWSQTLAAPNEVLPHNTEYSVLSTQYRTSRRHWWTIAAALAACVLVSFSLGFSMGGTFSPPIAKGQSPAASPQPTMATLAVHAGPDTTSEVQIPVMPGPSTAESPISTVPDYVRHKWERAGYQFSVERRYLFAKLSDGQQVVVPVEQIVVNQVFPKVY